MARRMPDKSKQILRMEKGRRKYYNKKEFTTSFETETILQQC